jgi:hypothetical protein
MPRDERQNDRIMEMQSIKNICITPSFSPITGKRRRMINACMVETNVPLNAFPTTIENLDTGATSISFIKPNSLSHIIDIDENMELNRMVIPMMPGKMNWIYGIPISGDTSLVSPPPTTKSHRTGLASVEISLPFSLTNFMNSLATIT